MDDGFPDDEDKPVIQFGRKLSLNFADKDDKENAKFNDARLVDILRNYPLLYNKSLESFGDPDYTQWMWGEIANEMNEPHRKTTMNLPFNWTNCRDQWEVVKRALRYLSNPAAKSFRYPKHFRECLEFFQSYIKDRREPMHVDRSQDLFINHTNLLEQLPFEKQLSLEKEVLDVILSNELEFCAPMVDPQAVEAQAREEFGRVIGMLMPEVDVSIVQNELATETEPFTMDELIERPPNSEVPATEPITDVTHLLDMYAKSGISLKRTVSQFDLDNLLQVPSKRVEILVPQMQLQDNIEYSVQNVIQEEIMQEADLQDVIEEDVIEEDIIEQDVIEEDAVQEDDVIEQDDAEEVVLQECVFHEDDMQEDVIEEVVSQDSAKDMPSLDIDGQLENPANRLDFASVLHQMLE